MDGMGTGSGMSTKGRSKGCALTFDVGLCNGVVYSCSIISVLVFRVSLVIQSLQEGEWGCDCTLISTIKSQAIRF